MIAGIADTHAALWHIFDDPRLSAASIRYIDQAANKGHYIAVSTVSLVEIVYLVEKKRLPGAAYKALRKALADPDHVLKEIPLTMEIADVLSRVTREEVPDMPDRMIAATAVALGVPIITRDGRIRSAQLKSIW